MTIAQYCVLGALNGLTQFFPVGASVHTVLLPWFLHWEQPTLALEAFLQLGALLAVFTYFARDWLGILKGGITSIIDRRIGFDRERMLFWMLVFAAAPTVIIGTLVGEEVEKTFRDPVLMAIPLALGGLFLYWIDGKYAALRNLDELGFKDAFFVGIGQALAIVPGVSRTGAAITMARLMGINREASARLAFLISFPLLLASCFLKFRLLSEQADLSLPLEPLSAALGCSFVFGLLTIHVILQFIRHSEYALFAWYRVMLGAGVILWSVYRG